MVQRPWKVHGANTGGFYRCKFYQQERQSMLDYEAYTTKEKQRLAVTAREKLNLAAEYTRLHTKAQVQVRGVVLLPDRPGVLSQQQHVVRRAEARV